jgi:hypothetical protein
MVDAFAEQAAGHGKAARVEPLCRGEEFGGRFSGHKPARAQAHAVSGHRPLNCRVSRSRQNDTAQRPIQRRHAEARSRRFMPGGFNNSPNRARPRGEPASVSRIFDCGIAGASRDSSDAAGGIAAL